MGKTFLRFFVENLMCPLLYKVTLRLHNTIEKYSLLSYVYKLPKEVISL